MSRFTSPAVSGSFAASAGNGRVERVLVTAVVFIVAIRYRFPPDIPIGFLVAVALSPITVRYLSQFRGATIIALLSVSAAFSGVILTFLHSGLASISVSLLQVQTWRAVGIPLVLATLLWARSVVGIQRVVSTFGLGSLASLVVTGLNLDNIWKFSLAVPIILIVLSLPGVYGRRVPQVICVLGLAGISAFGDSRSSAAMLLIAAALTIAQRSPSRELRASSLRAWLAIGQLALVGTAVYLAVQAAILEGALGTAVQERTEAQIELSGSVIVGGRPEMGATVALIEAQPWGYGSGSLVTFNQILTGKTGMFELGYDPNNGYVDNYMFGYGFEVHSLLGDLWLLFGIAGALTAISILLFSLYGVGLSLSTGSATTVVLFLALRLAWDFAFSPFASAMVYLPLVLAVTLAAREASRTGQAAVSGTEGAGSRRQSYDPSGVGDRSARAARRSWIQ